MQNLFVSNKKLIDRVLIVICTLFLITFAVEATFKAKNDAVWAEETELTFSGICFNGAKYWLRATEELVDGKSTPTYLYKGPAGNGSVHSNTPPKVIVERICRANAKIVSNI